ncbi:MAG: indolepyruvate ferredoxin oxidoreductase subunit alpha [bacterium]|nr:indolepyruvate ferredoxin oxidoreductase subunit alpha [bacterium]
MKSSLTVDRPGTEVLFSGNEAIARGCVEAGVSFVTGYPGTPTTPVIELLRSAGSEIGARWSVNEKVAMDIAAGHSWAGLRTLVTMKMSGLNVASDTVLSVAASGTVGGLVIYVGDDPGVYYGMVEQDSRYYALLSSAPMLVPANPQEMLDFTRYAFELSESIGGPVFLRSTTVLSYTYGKVTLGEIRRMRQKAFFTFDIDKFTKAGSARCQRQHKEAIERVDRAGSQADHLNLLTETGSRTGVIASSLSWDYLMEVLEKNNLDLTRLKVATAHPVPREKIRKILGSTDKVLVLEELDPLIEGAVRAESSMMEKPPVVYGKEDGLVPRVGDLSPDQVREYLGHVLGKKVEACAGIGAVALAEPLKVQRLLTFCAGCPHRSSYYALVKAMRELGKDPARTVVTGDIGCTILGINEPFSICWTEVSMGNSIGLAEGFLDAGMHRPVVATLGDGTFYHSGIPPIVNAVATGQDMPIIVLDNNWAAMTGYQETPGTVGGDEIRVPIEKIARGLGVRSVRVVKPYRTRKAVRAFKKVLTGSGVNVLVLRGPCVARQPRSWDRAVKVSDRKCPGFDRCERTCVEALACPAIVREGDKVRIDNEVCQSCGLCVSYCPKGAIRSNFFRMRRRKVGI